MTHSEFEANDLMSAYALERARWAAVLATPANHTRRATRAKPSFLARLLGR